MRLTSPHSRNQLITLSTFALSLILLTISFIRDLRYEKLYPDDLRNRIVGARLIYDGQSPYFYKWKPEHGMRYYDPANFNNLAISNITASPVLHQLFIPVCNLSQRTVSFIWLLAQYAILISMGLMAWKYAAGYGRHACLLIMATFPYTDAWVRHILTGQFYLLIPFFLFIIYVMLAGRRKSWQVLIAAICAVLIVLIRPFAFLSFIPLVFILPVTRKFILYSFAIGMVYWAFVLISPLQKHIYLDYIKFIKEATRLHQGKPVARQVNAPNPGVSTIEGFDIYAIRQSKMRDQIHSRNEHGNFFVLYEKLLHKKLDETWLLVGSLLVTFLIILAFYYGTAAYTPTLEQCLLIGFVIYMMLEMFLPTHRHQYNTVQFLFPLMLTGIHLHRIKPVPAMLVLLGLLLNITNWNIFPMKNTIGELMMLAGFFTAVISWKYRSNNYL
jgi:hypothetical protein